VTRIRLKNVDRFRDRYGKVRYYYRAGRGARVALPAAPGSPEFMLAYEQAARGELAESRPPERGDAGTFGRLVQDYLRSPDYLRLTASTQRSYRSVIERLVETENIGHRLVREMTREHVKRIVSKRAATPGAANDTLKKLKVLLNFAIDGGLRGDNPASRIKKFAAGEFHTWTDQEISTFESHWPVGTTARTAFALLLFTGQRRSDVVRMTRDDVQDNAIRVVQGKTGMKLWVAIHPALAEILAACDVREGEILRTAFGKPFTSNGFGNFMADKIAAAGLPDRCVTHGLRKAAARRLAEAGCSANEIAAITGHATLAEVSRYTKAAEQKRLARTAIERLPGGVGGIPFPNSGGEFGKGEEKPSEISGGNLDWRSLRESNPSFQIENLTS
jgi:enterobacteria phage integrase